jgi:hypothetical protein
MTFKERCDAVEECYEFLLAYAAKGLPLEQPGGAGSQLRPLLERAADVLTGLTQACSDENREMVTAKVYERFFGVVDRDAASSLAAIQLVLAQPSINSQLIDNLNASIHLRALLTDLFLLDEIFKARHG